MVHDECVLMIGVMSGGDILPCFVCQPAQLSTCTLCLCVYDVHVHVTLLPALIFITCLTLGWYMCNTGVLLQPPPPPSLPS